MKKKLDIIIIFFLSIILTGCFNKNDNDVINVLNWSSYIPDQVITNFENKTGIKVNYSTYSSNEELLAKISSSKEGTYDLIFPSDYMISLMIKRGLIQKLEKGNLKNISNINTNYMGLNYDSKNAYSIPFMAASTVIAYNSANIKEKITSYNDLLNPKYRNDIVLLDDQRIIIGMALQALGYDMNEVDENKLEQAKEWLLKLKSNVKAFDSDSPKTFLISKEVDIGVIWNAEAAIAMEENKDIVTVYPSDGFAVSIDNFAIPTGAKHISNTYKFIDYILTPSVMEKIVNEYPYKNINSKTEKLLDSKYVNNLAANIPDNIFKKGTFVNNIGSSIRDYDKIWAEIK